uniref:Uncharacterized protein n=1 Tax=Chromera velia CCMP2878 TaxID=1169474 RepID=A0A0G4FCU7_9ALVE|eukprot:Cvel_3216.t1-p1 / transcript=Cvel_3216.t1 / gene=Cvel_3216 / organism=Chromera_velia_CCMP2878 / gene_product=hypothetical protein / transcript_product=hypothetical protein / location=Cvel_scaffold125:125870-127775(-) / protein_length=339 / sequence_SO=supercontig / SO=protein_coding / is_pseudo=false
MSGFLPPLQGGAPHQPARRGPLTTLKQREIGDAKSYRAKIWAYSDLVFPHIYVDNSLQKNLAYPAHIFVPRPLHKYRPRPQLKPMKRYPPERSGRRMPALRGDSNAIIDQINQTDRKGSQTGGFANCSSPASTGYLEQLADKMMNEVFLQAAAAASPPITPGEEQGRSYNSPIVLSGTLEAVHKFSQALQADKSNQALPSADGLQGVVREARKELLSHLSAAAAAHVDKAAASGLSLEPSSPSALAEEALRLLQEKGKERGSFSVERGTESACERDAKTYLAESLYPAVESGRTIVELKVREEAREAVTELLEKVNMTITAQQRGGGEKKEMPLSLQTE